MPINKDDPQFIDHKPFIVYTDNPYSVLTTDDIPEGSITTDKIASGAVTGGKIANGAISESKLADNAVTSGKVADGAIGEAKLASSAVTSGKVADGAIGEAKLSSDVSTAIGSISQKAGINGENVNASEFCAALHVGDRVYKEQSTAVSVDNSTYTNITSIELPSGTWVITGGVQYAANGTGIRAAAISTATAAYDGAQFRAGGMRINAYATYDAFVNLARTLVLTAQTTIYLIGWQNSGGTLSAYGMLSAVRIK